MLAAGNPSHPTDTIKNNIALLVHACDRYELLYAGFEYFFNRHWDFSAPCNYYFATEEKHASVKNFTNIRSGKGAWADRLRYLLEEKITEAYVLYFQEDMWLDKNTDGSFFRQLLELTTQNNWDQVKLHSAGIYKTTPTDFFAGGFNLSLLDNKKSAYLLSHQVTLWKKEFLLAQLKKGEHPWRNERRGTKRLRKLNPPIYHADYFAENGFRAINRNKPAAVQSGYITVSQNSILRDTVFPGIGRLKKDPEMKAYGEKLQDHYDRQQTHDGLARARKIDPVKKFKNWLRKRVH